MDLRRRINAFLALGKRLATLPQEEKEELFEKSKYYNPWFTDSNLNLAWRGLLRYLQEEKLEAWAANYDLKNPQPKRVGVVMAGNIPMVGIHDLICVLLSGHSLVAKLSSQDEVLIQFVAKKLIEAEPEYQKRIFFVDRLKDIDAVIATGSDNTSRYFEYYFSKYPHIIRKNRTSVAVLTGHETDAELVALGDDIFTYFGMGCRNVSKIFLPEGQPIEVLFKHWTGYTHLADHHKYANNYHYQRSIMIMNMQIFQDNGFALFVESNRLVSPLAVVYYSYYSSHDDLKVQLSSVSDKLQCIVCKDGLLDGTNKFGTAQTPDVMDYADNVDTLKFLMEI
ncbi:MAG: acyl-CoA reductase [Cyclobacteriaceae bacterium]|nr:acyl-CoA reductase [Cyclobacteriaceae bacterium]